MGESKAPLVRFGLAAIALVLVAACSSETGGSPTSTTTGTGPSDQGAMASGVPTVENPLDVGSYVDRPCELVDKKVVSSIGSFEPPESDTDSKAAKKLTGPSCGWFPMGSGPTMSIVIDTVHRDTGTGGMRGVYDGKEVGLIEYTQRKKIPGYPGYPAVVAGTSNEVSSGQCPLHVGVSDDLLVIITVTNDDKPNQACPAALKVAASVLDTLKKGN